MTNSFGTDILIQARDPKTAARFQVEVLGFEISDDNPKMIGLHGKHINLFIEPGPPLGPVLQVTVDNVEKAKAQLLKNGCEIVKDEPEFPRCYIKDPYGLIYNLTSQGRVKAGAIIIIVIAASGVLMMRFRKRWLAKINIAFTNRITSLFAGWLPGFGILTHVGRKSGKVYRTPVNVFRAPDVFIIALTYSSQSEWVKNVLAAGGCDLKTGGKTYQLSAPKVVRDPTRRRFPLPVRVVLRIVGADEYMELSIAKQALHSPLANALSAQ